MAWWTTSDGLLTSLLLAGSGPPPTFAGAWLATLGCPGAGAGAWGIVDDAPLGPLAAGAQTCLRGFAREPRAEPHGPPFAAVSAGGELLAQGNGGEAARAECLRAARTLLAKRLSEPIVQERPATSGVVLARLVREGAVARICLAPAEVIDGTVATALIVRSIRFGVARPGGPFAWGPPLALDTAAELRPHEQQVQLGEAVEVCLPGATLGWELSRVLPAAAAAGDLLAARVAVALTQLRLPASIQRAWQPAPEDWPTLHLQLTA